MHRNFLRIVEKPRPAIFDFLVAVQRLENKTYMDLYRTINNITAPARRKKTYEQMDKIITDAETTLKADHDVENFLAKVSPRFSRIVAIVTDINEDEIDDDDEDSDDSDDGETVTGKCVICYRGESEYMLLNCYHIALCKKCVKYYQSDNRSMKQCPVCKGNISADPVKPFRT